MNSNTEERLFNMPTRGSGFRQNRPLYNYAIWQGGAFYLHDGTPVDSSRHFVVESIPGINTPFLPTGWLIVDADRLSELPPGVIARRATPAVLCAALVRERLCVAETRIGIARRRVMKVLKSPEVVNAQKQLRLQTMGREIDKAAVLRNLEQALRSIDWASAHIIFTSVEHQLHELVEAIQHNDPDLSRVPQESIDQVQRLLQEVSQLKKAVADIEEPVRQHRQHQRQKTS